MLPSLVPERTCGLWTAPKRANLCVYGSCLHFLGPSLPTALPQVFWTSRDEIQNCHPGSDVPKLAVSSSPEEWEKSGRTLFSNKRYLQAMHCFERAGLTREIAVSHTYYLRELARSTPITSSKSGILSRQTAFLAAAEAFVECSGSAKSAKEKKAYLRSAGDCFEHARDDYRAAQSYAQAEEYNTAVKLYRKCASFDEAVAIVTHNRQEVEEEVAENIIGVARLFYFKGGELEYVHLNCSYMFSPPSSSKAKQLFDSVEEQLKYLEDFDLDFSKAAVLENLGKFQDAAEIHLAEGRTTEAIRLFLIDKGNEESIARGRTCILQGLWEKASFNTRGLNRSEEVVELLKLASNFSAQSKAIVDPVVNDEVGVRISFLNLQVSTYPLNSWKCSRQLHRPIQRHCVCLERGLPRKASQSRRLCATTTISTICRACLVWLQLTYLSFWPIFLHTLASSTASPIPKTLAKIQEFKNSSISFLPPTILSFSAILLIFMKEFSNLKHPWLVKTNREFSYPNWNFRGKLTII